MSARQQFDNSSQPPKAGDVLSEIRTYSLGYFATLDWGKEEELHRRVMAAHRAGADDNQIASALVGFIETNKIDWLEAKDACLYVVQKVYEMHPAVSDLGRTIEKATQKDFSYLDSSMSPAEHMWASLWVRPYNSFNRLLHPPIEPPHLGRE